MHRESALAALRPVFLSLLPLVLCLFVPLSPPRSAAALEHLRLSTTTSTENSGLLEVLLPPFEERHGCRVDVIPVGTGKALKLGESGDVDLVLVHAREQEEKFVSEGFGVERRRVMYNHFVIVGPPADPGGVRGSKDAVEAFGRIAAAASPFISRGDESGTHQREKKIWEAVKLVPAGRWYVESGLGMGAVIHMATQRQAYTLSDAATYHAFRHKTDLELLFQADPRLVNPYSVIAVNPARHPHVKHRLALRLVEYLTGEEARQIIEHFRIDGEPAFFVDRGRER